MEEAINWLFAALRFTHANGGQLGDVAYRIIVGLLIELIFTWRESLSPVGLG